MPFTKVSVIAFSLVGVAGLMAPSALSAWELTSNPDCTNMSVLLTQEQCSGAYSLDPGENDITDGDADNIVTTILNDDDLFGAEDWTFLGKDDGNGTDYFTVTGIGSHVGHHQPEWHSDFVKTLGCRPRTDGTSRSALRLRVTSACINGR